MSVKQMTLWFLILITPAVMGQINRGAENQRVQRDLRIMEGVLDKILVESDGPLAFTTENTRGIYLDQFGFIFHTSQDNPHSLGFPAPLLEFEYLNQNQENMDTENHDIENESSHREESPSLSILSEDLKKRYFIEAEERKKAKVKLEQRLDQAMDNLHQRINRFIKTYASVIQPVSDDDRMAVLVKMKNITYGETGSRFVSVITRLNDLQQYKKKKISDAQLEERIHFQISKSDSPIQQEIDIMNEIIQRGLKETSSRSGSSEGIYIQGLGALFFVENSSFFLSSHGSSFSIVASSSNDSKNDNVIVYPQHRSIEKKEADMDDIQNSLFTVLSDFGHTLSIKEDEFIVINYDFGHRLFFENSKKTEATNWILQLKKSDLTAFNDGRITSKELKKRMVTQTY